MTKISSNMRAVLLAMLLSLLALAPLFAQDYQLVWEDNFDGNALNPKVWSVESKVGIWNTGANRELQHYRHENVTVGTDGDGNNCLILTAKKESHNGYDFTSGKIESKGKFTFKYGRLEARIKMPNLANGLWPAFWLIGHTGKTWPDCGEIDIVEMGHASAISNGTVNKHHSGALHWEHADNYAGYSTGSDATTDLNAGYHVFTLEWSPEKVSMFIDNNTEPYFAMDIIGADLEEFRDYPAFIIFNLAVGGQFPSIYNASGITASMPANMYIDYVRLYQKNGVGQINTSASIMGNFGVFTETAQVFHDLDYGYDASIEASGLTPNTTEQPKEGTQVLAYETQSNQAFELKSQSVMPLNMANYANGVLSMYVKTNITSDLTIAIADTNHNSSQIVLSGDLAYNPTRNNAWQRVVIPLADMVGDANLQCITGFLVVKGQTSGVEQLAIDNVVWAETVENSAFFGLYTENPNITSKVTIDDNSVFLYIWENTLTPLANAVPYEGADVLAFRDNGVGWYGLGIFSVAGVDIERYKNGYLFVTLQTESTTNFWIGIGGANNTEGRIVFNYGADPYGFKRDGTYQTLVIPMADLNAYSIANKGKDLDLSQCGNVFMFGGDRSLTAIGIDDAYLALDQTPIENPQISKLSSVVISPGNAVIKVGQSVKLNAIGYNQFGGRMSIDPVWTVSEGGFVTSSGEFLGLSEGVFTVTATVGSLSGKAKVAVAQAVGINDELRNSLLLFPNPAHQQITVQSAQTMQQVLVFDAVGRLVYQQSTQKNEALLNIGFLPNGAYLVTVTLDNGHVRHQNFIKN